MLKKVLLLGLIPTLLMAQSPEEKGLAISKANDKANEGFKTDVSIMQMELINAYGDTIVRRMTSKILEQKKDGDKSVTEFLWPADVKGTKLLTWTHKVKNDDQWLYLPALKRIKRISSSNQSGSFMGSEFSYEDVSSQEIEKFTYKFIREDKMTYGKGEAQEERDIWVIERYPVNKKSGYSKQVTYIDKIFKNPLKIDYYDRKGELLKSSTFSDYQNYNGLWRQNKIAMVNHQTKKSSILTWTERELGKAIPAKEFYKNALLR